MNKTKEEQFKQTLIQQYEAENGLPFALRFDMLNDFEQWLLNRLSAVNDVVNNSNDQFTMQQVKNIIETLMGIGGI